MAIPLPDKLRYLGANIRLGRRRRGWTQERLAEVAGLDPRYVRTLESAKANPKAAVLLAVAEALGISLGPLFRKARIPKKKPGRPRLP